MNAIESFHRASSNALSFNQETFIEVRDDLLIFSRNLPLNIVTRFFEQYLNYLNLMSEGASQENRELLQASQELISQKKDELALLSPVIDYSKQGG
jgi:hypothetical protein